MRPNEGKKGQKRLKGPKLGQKRRKGLSGQVSKYFLFSLCIFGKFSRQPRHTYTTGTTVPFYGVSRSLAIENLNRALYNEGYRCTVQKLNIDLLIRQVRFLSDRVDAACFPVPPLSGGHRKNITCSMFTILLADSILTNQNSLRLKLNFHRQNPLETKISRTFFWTFNI